MLSIFLACRVTIVYYIALVTETWWKEEQEKSKIWKNIVTSVDLKNHGFLSVQQARTEKIKSIHVVIIEKMMMMFVFKNPWKILNF